MLDDSSRELAGKATNESAIIKNRFINIIGIVTIIGIVQYQHY
jgi:hypothetical protein